MNANARIEKEPTLLGKRYEQNGEAIDRASPASSPRIAVQ
jgi:hypothetical protein